MIPNDLESRSATEQWLCLPAELDHLPMFLDHVRRTAEVAGITNAQAARLELAVEEALVNVCHYAYAAPLRTGTLRCHVVVQPDGLQVEIIDEGPPFDPLAQANPDTALGLDQREPGGLGILLIKKLVSEVSYCRVGDQNVLTIQMRK